MSTIEFASSLEERQLVEPTPKRRRRRRTQKQLEQLTKRAKKREERSALSPIQPVSPSHPVGHRPIHEFRTTGQIAQALRIARTRVHELMRQGRLTPTPVRMGIDTFLFHKTTAYQRRIPNWVTRGKTVSAENGENES